MSRHRSYGKATTGAKKRNVLKRFERVQLMKERDQWKERVSVFSLPKTKVAS
jgi:small basic protein (TIGR04137 family)